jgi:hypothetical protein
MKKNYILGLLFFSGLWGFSEAILGDALYRVGVPFASVPLTIIAFIILAFANVYMPRAGIATLVAAAAMLYKFLNVPFFACHLLGILLIGICFDLLFNVFAIKNRSVSAIAATYLNYALFAIMITYVFQYEHWVRGGFSAVLRHIGISGSLTAVACAVLVPLTFRIAGTIKANYGMPFKFRWRLVTSGVSLAAIGLWVFGFAAWFLNG